jgi:hypothetical protein
MEADEKERVDLGTHQGVCVFWHSWSGTNTFLYVVGTGRVRCAATAWTTCEKGRTLYGTARRINGLLAVKGNIEALGVAGEEAYRNPGRATETPHQKSGDVFYHTTGESAKATRDLSSGLHPDFGNTSPLPQFSTGKRLRE